ncbi:uncharacterized protein LOC141600859 [Silene latifolia]|uniref:uncharacterized protein LOC141600859 n=1 Tax=Silene latifolia TaxID=37657 RepID=UPI003D7856EA
MDRRKLFRFEQVWVGEDGCEEGIRRAWDKGEEGMFDNLMNFAKELQEWKRVSIGKILRDIHLKRKKLMRFNEGDRSLQVVQERRKLVNDITKLLRQEEVFWRQRSRALWLKEGDRNTKYFHRKAGQRKKKNHIAKLIDDEGRVHEGTKKVSAIAKEYFKELFTSGRPCEFEGLLDVVDGRVTADMNENLREDYSEEEVVHALNQRHPLKAPGPEGMNGLFFQTYWHIVGKLVVKTVLGILRGASFPMGTNITYIVLISKKKAPDKMVDFRPISLCNIIYKFVSKVLASRLKRILGDIVSENQSAFTPGPLIIDNIEVFRHMKNSRGGVGHMALKLDMSKAYDRVEWTFLERVLRRMGFDAGWVGRVMECVSSVSFAVMANEAESIKVKEILKTYEEASGQMVNFNKTTVSFSRGMRGARRNQVAAWLGVRAVMEQNRYLGLPTVVGHSRNVVSKVVREKLSVKLQGWKRMLLSKAGREAGLGVNPSYTGRRIWETRDVLRFRLRRKIGDGHDTTVWVDPWVPKTQSRMIISPRGDACEDLKVADLLRDDGCGWNVEKGVGAGAGGEGRYVEGDDENRRKGRGNGEGIEEAGERWLKPREGVVKINVDAGVKEGYGTGLGLICRDEKGEVLWGWAERRREEMEPQVAEAEVIFIGIQKAKSFGHSAIIMESDCKVVVDELTNRSEGRSDVHMIVDDIVESCREFSCVAWSFVSRKFNRVAHELAYLCPTGGSASFDRDSFPMCIANIVAMI